MHTAFTPPAYHEPNQLDPVKPIQNHPNHIPTNRMKDPCAHDREHNYHDSLHSTEVAQHYP
jgi:hypothetical protein